MKNFIQLLFSILLTSLVFVSCDISKKFSYNSNNQKRKYEHSNIIALATDSNNVYQNLSKNILNKNKEINEKIFTADCTRNITENQYFNEIITLDQKVLEKQTKTIKKPLGIPHKEVVNRETLKRRKKTTVNKFINNNDDPIKEILAIFGLICGIVSFIMLVDLLAVSYLVFFWGGLIICIIGLIVSITIYYKIKKWNVYKIIALLGWILNQVILVSILLAVFIGWFISVV